MIDKEAFLRAVKEERRALFDRVGGLVLTHGGMADKADSGRIIWQFRSAVDRALRQARVEADNRSVVARWWRGIRQYIRGKLGRKR